MLDKVEIIDLIDTSKENEVYEDESIARGGAFGGLLQNKPLVGGGYNPRKYGPPIGGGYSQYCKILCHPNNSFIEMLDTRSK